MTILVQSYNIHHSFHTCYAESFEANKKAERSDVFQTENENPNKDTNYDANEDHNIDKLTLDNEFDRQTQTNC